MVFVVLAAHLVDEGYGDGEATCNYCHDYGVTHCLRPLAASGRWLAFLGKRRVLHRSSHAQGHLFGLVVCSLLVPVSINTNSAATYCASRCIKSN